MRRDLAPGCISSEVNLCQRKPLFPFFRDPFFGDPFFSSFFLFFLSPAKVGSLEMQPGAKLQAYLGVVMLQPHACAQRFRFQILRRTRSFPGRTSARSLSGRIESIWETPSKEKASGFANGLQQSTTVVCRALRTHTKLSLDPLRKARSKISFLLLTPETPSANAFLKAIIRWFGMLSRPTIGPV